VAKREVHGHRREPENLVGKHFAAFRFAGRNLCCRCRAYHVGNISCVGSKDVADIGWLPELPEGQPKLRELQAVHPTFLLPALEGPIAATAGAGSGSVSKT
jgi:hypothetical protein